MDRCDKTLAFTNQEFGSDECFLCGQKNQKITPEHIFPRWLQRDLGLWDLKLDLLNKSPIPYRLMTIPCCEQCNNNYLSRLENEVKQAVFSGFEASQSLPKYSWYLWAAKIHYGILRKELNLAFDRTKNNGDSIVSEDYLTQFQSFHLFLQGIRGKHAFKGKVPYSVLVCNLHNTGEEYDFRDNLYLSTFSLRIKETGIIVVFEGGNTIDESYGRYVSELKGEKIHPIQFSELYAKVNYELKRRHGNLAYLTTQTESSTEPVITQILDDGYFMEPWSSSECSAFIQEYISASHFKNLNPKFLPSTRNTWMYDESGNILTLPLSDWVNS